MDRACQVRHCGYVAEASIDDGDDHFLVCELHDHPATRRILERGERPAHYRVASGFPVVLSCGPLEAEHLEPRSAPAGVIRARECSWLASLPEGPAPGVHPDSDLTR